MSSNICGMLTLAFSLQVWVCLFLCYLGTVLERFKTGLQQADAVLGQQPMLGLFWSLYDTGFTFFSLIFL